MSRSLQATCPIDRAEAAPLQIEGNCNGMWLDAHEREAAVEPRRAKVRRHQKGYATDNKLVTSRQSRTRNANRKRDPMKASHRSSSILISEYLGWR